MTGLALDRWWADAGKSLHALGLVGERDVTMGVGTAVLGYHGLSLEGLAPLSGSTLVDGRRLARAVSVVDLAPVAGALSKAMRPVMGEASDAYGLMLAEDLHANAIEGSLGLFASLTQSGIPYPMAVDRVMAVHGIPASRLGQVSKHLREPRLSRDVLDDWADRALMEFASHTGRMQAAGGVEVSKSGAFQESEHPRAADGKFRNGAQAPPGGRSPESEEERRARKDRRLRRMKRLVMQQGALRQMQQQREEQRAADLKREQAARARPAARKPAAELKPVAPVNVYGQLRSRKPAAGKQQSAVPRPVEEQQYEDLDYEAEVLSTPQQGLPEQHSMTDDRFIVMMSSDFAMLQSHGGEFWAGGFNQLVNERMTARTASAAKDYVQGRINDEPGTSADDFVLLHLTGRIPLENAEANVHEQDAVLVPASAKFSLDDILMNRFDYHESLRVEQSTGNPQDALKGDKYLRIANINLENEKSFPLTNVSNPRRYVPADVDEDGWPNDVAEARRSRWTGGKSFGLLAKAAAFRESEHPRAADGTFKDTGEPPVSGAKASLLERKARRERRMRRQQRIAVQVSAIRQAREEAAAAEREQQEAAARAQQERRRMAPLKAKPAAPVNVYGRRDARRRAASAIRQAQEGGGDFDSLGLDQAFVFGFEEYQNMASVTGILPTGEQLDPREVRALNGFDDETPSDILSMRSRFSHDPVSAVMLIAQRYAASNSRPIAGEFDSQFDALEAAEKAAGVGGFAYVLPLESNEDGSPRYKAFITNNNSETREFAELGVLFTSEAVQAAISSDGAESVVFEPVKMESGGEVTTIRQLLDRLGVQELGYDPIEFPDLPIQAIRGRVRENQGASGADSAAPRTPSAGNVNRRDRSITWAEQI